MQAPVIEPAICTPGEADGHRRISGESVERLLDKSGAVTTVSGPAGRQLPPPAAGPERPRVLQVEDDPNLLRQRETGASIIRRGSFPTTTR